MRIRVTLQVERETTIPINYQHQLSSAIYRFLETADADYAQFLHAEGYAPVPLSTAEPEQRPSFLATESGAAVATMLATSTMPRRFKLFTFSHLRAQHSRAEGALLRLSAGEVQWFVSSPVDAFVSNFASGLLTLGRLRVGSKEFGVAQVESLPSPLFAQSMRFKCLSPIVASVGESTDGRRYTRYLRPKDPAFSERVRQNLLSKYSALHGTAPHDEQLSLQFDSKYLQQHRGTKLVTYKDGIQIVGAFAPLTMSGSTELMQLAYESGVGEKNAAGFGMVEVTP